MPEPNERDRRRPHYPTPSPWVFRTALMVYVGVWLVMMALSLTVIGLLLWAVVQLTQRVMTVEPEARPLMLVAAQGPMGTEEAVEDEEEEKTGAVEGQLVAPIAPVGGGGRCRMMTITAYSVEQFPGTTASGLRTPGQVGAIAAHGNGRAGDPGLPFGTRIWIDGFGSRTVQDRGGGLNSSHVDVLVQTTREALQIGRVQRQVCY